MNSPDPAVPKNPLLNLAASVIANINCCNCDHTEQNTYVHDNIVTGEVLQNDNKIVASTSNISQDIIPKVIDTLESPNE